jgi:putative DNA primase/helicase
VPSDPFPDYDLEALLRLEVPPRQWLAEGLIAERGLAMVHAKRGVGKTYFVLRLACAIASGKHFLRYRVPAPAGVLLVDGEMPTPDLQERLRLNVRAGFHPEVLLRFLCADLAERSLPSLATSEGQAVIEDKLTPRRAEPSVHDGLPCDPEDAGAGRVAGGSRTKKGGSVTLLDCLFQSLPKGVEQRTK